MNRQSQAAEIIDAVGAPGFRTLSDFYHMQLEEKDIARRSAAMASTRHTCIWPTAPAGATGAGVAALRLSPGFHALKKWGYAGWLTWNPALPIIRKPHWAGR